jgi:hypothetical protein
MLLLVADNFVKVYRLAFVSFFGKDKFFVAILASLQNFDKAPPAISQSPKASNPLYLLHSKKLITDILAKTKPTQRNMYQGKSRIPWKLVKNPQINIAVVLVKTLIHIT